MKEANWKKVGDALCAVGLVLLYYEYWSMALLAVIGSYWISFLVYETQLFREGKLFWSLIETCFSITMGGFIIRELILGRLITEPKWLQICLGVLAATLVIMPIVTLYRFRYNLGLARRSK